MSWATVAALTILDFTSSKADLAQPFSRGERIQQLQYLEIVAVNRARCDMRLCATGGENLPNTFNKVDWLPFVSDDRTLGIDPGVEFCRMLEGVRQFQPSA